MNAFKITLVFLLVSLTTQLQLLAQQCDPTLCKAAKKGISDQTAPSKLAQFASVKSDKTATITFEKGKLIEVGLFSITPGKESQVQEDYFPKIFPIAAEYGLKPMQTFMIHEKMYGENPAKMVGFFEWPSLEQKRAFDQDPRFLKLRNVRNGGLDFLALGYFKVEETTQVTFSSDKIYDFASLWIDPDHATKLEAYFEKVGPIAMSPKYGYKPLVRLQPLGVHDQNYHPSLIALAEWGAEDSFEKLQKNEQVYKQNVHLREAATPYKDVFLLKAIIQ